MELKHYGILGMKWGIRRYQNPDGTLTAAGKRRYGAEGEYHYESRQTKRAKEAAEQMRAYSHSSERKERYANRVKDYERIDAEREKYAKSLSYGKALLQDLFYGPRYSVALAVGKLSSGNESITRGEKISAAFAANNFTTGMMYKIYNKHMENVRQHNG